MSKLDNNAKLISIRPYNKGFMVLTYKNADGKWDEIVERDEDETT